MSKLSKAPDHPRLQVTRKQAPTKERMLTSITGLSLNIPLQINNGDINTLECALKERLFYREVDGQFLEPPVATRQVIDTKLGEFAEELARLLPSTTPLTTTQVVESYRGRRHTIYANAEENLHQIGLKRSDATSIAFVKVEKVKDGAPRCIQPRKPIYNLMLGKYIKKVEHRIYDAIRKMFKDGPTVMKGYNVEHIGNIIRGKWRAFKDPVAVGLDASRFDQHVCEHMLRWEHDVYRRMFPKCEELGELLDWQLNNVGRGYCPDGSLKYTVTGRRFSGDMNTALGNCLIMCAMVYSYSKERRVHVSLANNGDDCTVIMEKKDLTRFMNGLEEWFLELGFVMKAEEPVYKLCQIEFCQMHPVEVGDKCIMVRNINAAMRKDTLSVIPLTMKREVQCLLTAIGEGGLSLTGGVPIIQNFYRRYMEIGGGVKSKVGENHAIHTGLRLLSVGMSRGFQEPLAETRVQVMEAWGYTPDEQVCLERLIDDYQLDFDFTEVDNLNTTEFLIL